MHVYVCVFLTVMQTRLRCLRNPQLYVREHRQHVNRALCAHRLLVSFFSLKNSPAPKKYLEITVFHHYKVLLALHKELWSFPEVRRDSL